MDNESFHMGAEWALDLFEKTAAEMRAKPGCCTECGDIWSSELLARASWRIVARPYTESVGMPKLALVLAP